ncbi:uncharacterized protein L969DRAFT_93942 [Mixia osmundae IAM 14324]|uniref:Uncharacterized protein n=1 Tax=Mixia osmundae (strain CBS 9802 / IAM 14324 / JCM 22182 / KY 12970) TaxID=764103 RepID=G7E8L4_MIXOS|nr:uncharacterized protein L969DRAFT_93942 [Mixia osmundae IAM 14324]KEI40116.1 hypothetical protein L969DRAFT_93942 [Mixia osmundae IAM 14324]GAA99482.1 hypothetical protein E5Q_06182 [Mixia osmundae IAM 14324]
MASELSYPDARFIMFSDFDGTITTEDSNDHMTDNLGMGVTERRKYNEAILNGSMSFRDAFAEELQSVSKNHSFPDCQSVLKKNIKLDPGFKAFLDYADQAGIPVVIVSSGMVPIIRSILSNLIGQERADKLEIVANDVTIHSDKSWEIKYRHPDSHYGHDKSRALRPYAAHKPRPTIFFAGDGVSDQSAAGESDILYVKIVPDGHNDLAAHCQKKGVPFVPFLAWDQIRDSVRDVVDGKVSVKDVQDGKATITAAAEALQKAQARS